MNNKLEEYQHELANAIFNITQLAKSISNKGTLGLYKALYEFTFASKVLCRELRKQINKEDNL